VSGAGVRPRSAPEAVRHLLGRGSIYTLVLGIQMSVALLVVPIVTRLLPADGYGKVAAGLVVFNLVSILGAAGLPESASRAFFRGPRGPRNAHQLVVATAVSAATVAVLADISGGLWAPLFGMHYSGLIRLAVWGGAAAAAMISAQTLLRAWDRAWAFVGVAVVACVGAQGAGLVLTVLLGTPTAYMTGLAAGTAAACAAAFAVTGSIRHGLPRRPVLKRGLSLGLPMLPHSLSVYLLASADRVAIAGILGLGAVGRYQVAYTVGAVGVSLITALNQAWLPVLLGAPDEERAEIIAATSRVVHKLCVVVASGLALAAPVALAVAAPASYDRPSLVPVSAVVSFSILPYATSSTFFNALFVAGRTRIMLVAAPLAVVANIVLNLVLLRVVGLVGASYATVGAYAVLAVVAAWGANRVAKLHREALYDPPAAWLIAAPFVAAGAALPGMGVGLAVRALLGLALAAWLVRMVAAETSARRLPTRALRSRRAAAELGGHEADEIIAARGAS
jgi:O-antigen/teichoic acid export membrane protein